MALPKEMAAAMMAKSKDEQGQDAGAQAADLAELHAQAAEEAPPPVIGPDGRVVEEPPQIDLGAELAGLVSAVVAILRPAYPTATALYTPEVIDTATGAVARVCAKRGWLQDGVVGEYGEEVAAAVVLLPLAVATVGAVKADHAARSAARGEGPAPAGTGQDAPRAAAPVPAEQVEAINAAGGIAISFGGGG